MYRNLTMFRFPVSADSAGLMHTRLASGAHDCALKPVGPLELSSRGFVSPFGRDSEVLAHRVGNCIGLTVGGEDKILPASVVNDLLAKKLAEVERAEGRKPGGRARKRMKEDIVFELLPRAMVKPSRLDGYLDLDLGVLFVDTASRKQAESFVSELRHALGSFPVLPLNAEVAPRLVLTRWLHDGDHAVNPNSEDFPKGCSIGDEAILKDAADKGATARYTRQDLQVCEEIESNLSAGKQVTRLALTFDDRISFTLDEDLAIRKLKFLDGAMESLESSERDDLAAELDARFALMSGELARLFPVLESALSLSKVD